MEVQGFVSERGGSMIYQYTVTPKVNFNELQKLVPLQLISDKS